MDLISFTARPWLKWTLIGAGLLLAAVIFSRVLQPGFDLYIWFYPAARSILQGDFAYAQIPRLNNPPWALGLLAPIGWLTPELAHGLLVVVTLLALFWGMSSYRRVKVSYPLAALSLPMLSMVWLGQLEVFSLLGTMLGYVAAKQHRPWWFAVGLLLLAVKPQETWLILLLLLIGSFRLWSWREWAKIVGVVGVVALLSSLWLGGDWLLRMINAPATYAADWENFSVWHIVSEHSTVLAVMVWASLAAVVVWALRTAGLTRWGLACAAVGANVLSPYLTEPHLLMTMCFSWGLLFDRSAKWGAVTYLASLTPLLRIITGNQALNQLDVIFPLLVLGGLSVQVMAKHKAPLLQEGA